MFLAEFDFEDSPLQFYKAPNGEPVITAYSLIKALKGDTMNAARIAKNNVRSKWTVEIPNPNGGRAILCLFEPGAYQLAGNPMFQTELAEKLQDYMFEKVMVKLRSQGYYIAKTDDVTLAAMKSEIATLQHRLSYATDLLATDIKTFLSRGLPHLTSGCINQDAKKINLMMIGSGVAYVDYRDRYHIYSLSDLQRYTSEHFGEDSSYTRQTAQYWNT
jgi:prophage antirepressor-like protein